MAILTKQQLKFQSRPYEQRIALIPMRIGIVLGWAWLIIALLLAGYAIQQNLVFGSIMLLGIFAMVIYMAYVTYQWIQDSTVQYRLLIGGDLISLSELNPEHKTRVNQQICLRDVTDAEYYPAQDTSTLVLRSRIHNLHIPLWSFGPDAERTILRNLKSRGVEIIGIPEDFPV